jgi:hypothetical protein
MPADITVQFKISSSDDPSKPPTISDLTIAQGGAAVAKLPDDFYKAHYAEAMSSYRYFGTLRAAIAWTPATIAMTLITYLATGAFVKEHVLLWYAVPLALAGVFVLIFVANVHLQKQQRKSSNAAKKAQHYWVTQNQTPRFYLALTQDLPKGDALIRSLALSQRGWPDTSSWCLLVFFIVLLIINGYSVMETVGGYDVYRHGGPPPSAANPASPPGGIQNTPADAQ